MGKEYREQSTENRVQRTEYRVQSTENRVQSTENREQRTENREQSTGVQSTTDLRGEFSDGKTGFYCQLILILFLDRRTKETERVYQREI